MVQFTNVLYGLLASQVAAPLLLKDDGPFLIISKLANIDALDSSWTHCFCHTRTRGCSSTSLVFIGNSTTAQNLFFINNNKSVDYYMQKMLTMSREIEDVRTTDR
jgi:hypothetical protein